MLGTGRLRLLTKAVLHQNAVIPLYQTILPLK